MRKGIKGEERGEEETGKEERRHLAEEVMTQHIHLGGRCRLLLLHRGHKLLREEGREREMERKTERKSLCVYGEGGAD